MGDAPGTSTASPRGSVRGSVDSNEGEEWWNDLTGEEAVGDSDIVGQEWTLDDLNDLELELEEKPSRAKEFISDALPTDSVKVLEPRGEEQVAPQATPLPPPVPTCDSEAELQSVPAALTDVEPRVTDVPGPAPPLESVSRPSLEPTSRLDPDLEHVAGVKDSGNVSRGVEVELSQPEPEPELEPTFEPATGTSPHSTNAEDQAPALHQRTAAWPGNATDESEPPVALTQHQTPIAGAEAGESELGSLVGPQGSDTRLNPHPDSQTEAEIGVHPGPASTPKAKKVAEVELQASSEQLVEPEFEPGSHSEVPPEVPPGTASESHPGLQSDQICSHSLDMEPFEGAQCAHPVAGLEAEPLPQPGELGCSLDENEARSLDSTAGSNQAVEGSPADSASSGVAEERKKIDRRSQFMREIVKIQHDRDAYEQEAKGGKGKRGPPAGGRPQVGEEGGDSDRSSVGSAATMVKPAGRAMGGGQGRQVAAVTGKGMGLGGRGGRKVVGAGELLRVAPRITNEAKQTPNLAGGVASGSHREGGGMGRWQGVSGPAARRGGWQNRGGQEGGGLRVVFDVERAERRIEKAPAAAPASQPLPAVSFAAGVREGGGGGGRGEGWGRGLGIGMGMGRGLSELHNAKGLLGAGGLGGGAEGGTFQFAADSVQDARSRRSGGERGAVVYWTPATGKGISQVDSRDRPNRVSVFDRLGGVEVHQEGGVGKPAAPRWADMVEETDGVLPLPPATDATAGILPKPITHPHSDFSRGMGTVQGGAIGRGQGRERRRGGGGSSSPNGRPRSGENARGGGSGILVPKGFEHRLGRGSGNKAGGEGSGYGMRGVGEGSDVAVKQEGAGEAEMGSGEELVVRAYRDVRVKKMKNELYVPRRGQVLEG